MFKVYRYTMAYTFRKVTTWLFLGLLTVFMFGISYGISSSVAQFIDSSKPRISLSFTGIMSTSVYIFISMLLMSYIAIKISNIFKDGETDGTTLLLVSKRFTRGDVIFGKVLAVASHLIMASVFTSFGLLITDLLLPGPSGYQYVLSTFVGLMILGCIYSSIVMLFATSFAKVGTLFLSIFIGVSLPVISIVLKTTTGGIVYSEASTNVSVSIEDGEFIKPTYWFEEPRKSSDDGLDGDFNPEDEGMYKLIKLSEKYGRVKYFDLWEQISSPLSMFVSDVPTDVELSSIKTTDKEFEDFKDNNMFLMTNDDTDYTSTYLDSYGEAVFVFSIYDDDTGESRSYSASEVQPIAKQVLADVLKINPTTKTTEFQSIIEGMLKNIIISDLNPGDTTLEYSKLIQLARWVLLNHGSKIPTLLEEYKPTVSGKNYLSVGSSDWSYTSKNLSENSSDWINGSNGFQLELKTESIDLGGKIYEETNFYLDGEKLIDDHYLHQPWTSEHMESGIISEFALSSMITSTFSKIDNDFRNGKGYSLSTSTLGDPEEEGNTLVDYVGNVYVSDSVEFMWQLPESRFENQLVFTPYFNRLVYGLIWTTISLILFSATIAIYFKRDFK